MNKKNGIHVYFPDLAADRRKLIEIRMDALAMCTLFEGSINEPEDIMDEGVYKAARFFHKTNKKNCL